MTTADRIDTERLGSRITDEMLERARAMIGVEHRVKPNGEFATRDAIRHWCMGVGDLNPLYINEAYAKGTRYGNIIAPPNFLTVAATGSIYPFDARFEIPPERRVRGSNFPGIGALHGGGETEYLDIIRLDDELYGTSYSKDVSVVNSQFSGTAVKTVGETVWRRADGSTVAISRGWGYRMDRDAGRSQGKYEGGKYQYNQDELDEIAADYRRVELRGAIPRYWEDVQVDDDMGMFIKGPLTVTSQFAFLGGWGGTLFAMGSKIARDCLHDKPRAGIPDPETNVVDFPERIHWDDVMARNVGVPAAFDMGPQRIAWFVQFLTNWMGDDGFLKMEHCEVRMPNIMGDTLRFKGRVQEKWQEDGENLVRCEVVAENQRGGVTTRGWGIVSLPSKANGGTLPPQIARIARDN
jgi:acyl dehydratase